MRRRTRAYVEVQRLWDGVRRPYGENGFTRGRKICGGPAQPIQRGRGWGGHWPVCQNWINKFLFLFSVFVLVFKNFKRHVQSETCIGTRCYLFIFINTVYFQLSLKRSGTKTLSVQWLSNPNNGLPVQAARGGRSGVRVYNAGGSMPVNLARLSLAWAGLAWLIWARLMSKHGLTRRWRIAEFFLIFCRIAESTRESLPLSNLLMQLFLPLFAIIWGFSDTLKKTSTPRRARCFGSAFRLKKSMLSSVKFEAKLNGVEVFERRHPCGPLEQACAMRSTLPAKPNRISRISMRFLLLTVLLLFRLIFFEVVCCPKRRSHWSSIPVGREPKNMKKMDVWMKAARIPTAPT